MKDYETLGDIEYAISKGVSFSNFDYIKTNEDLTEFFDRMKELVLQGEK